MPPRKKLNSSTVKKSQSLSSPQIQPTKFGIQHFFERHTQNSKNVAVSSTPLNPHPHFLNSNPKSASHSLSTQNPPDSSLHNTPPDDMVSPEISKSLPLKRFKFSPGMLIKQSQDDGGDEITWKISPVNEKLQSRVVSNSSRLNSSTIRQCCLNQACL
ncbi:hypothetical protein Pint_00020 [Pistacia integerrima]|uniref:Uncharacterized protein n=1 Tax=Pistacia integerrima TaxID=434235 RepID=A0ACC0ZK57_9ROSI|nr:hypothetical protein Pint_00020 [Pistacia integerrima]